MYRILLLTVTLAACAKHTTAPGSNAADERESASDNPATLLPSADTRLVFNIVASDVGATYGVDDGHVPYPDTYWPFVDNGVDNDWSNSGSPLAKYMNQVDPQNVASAQAWENTNHGKAVPGVADWFGHCPGWTGSSIVNAPLQHAVMAKYSNGQFVGCDASDSACTRFEIGDVNALMAEVFVDSESAFIGSRCDTAPTAVTRDANGRINQPGCKGINPGTLMVVLGNRVRSQRLPVAIDAQNDFNTDQIWNQPAYRYTVYRYTEIDAPTAVQLVQGTPGTNYIWDTDAQGFVFVDLGIWWVSEHGPNLTPYSGLQSSQQMRITAVIELDAAPSDPNAHIIGGEYVADSGAGTTRLTVPPFLWIATDAGPETGGTHNPYVRSSLVKQLIVLGQN